MGPAACQPVTLAHAQNARTNTLHIKHSFVEKTVGSGKLDSIGLLEHDSSNPGLAYVLDSDFGCLYS